MRNTLIAVSLLMVPVCAQGADSTLTARQVIERVQKNVGVPWQAQTVDTFKAGNPDTPVTGIATTFLATMDVLQRAAASGKNLVITHEPTFYNHLDQTADLQKDPVYQAKMAFIKEHNMVVFRFHDHWHMRHPDGIIAGDVQALGWKKFQDPNSEYLFTMPETTLKALSADIRDRLSIKTMRVIGDPQLKIRKVALVPGAAPTSMQMKAMQRDDVDAVVVGESREWETVEYARDAVTQGRHKALIIMGHVVSEEPGMDECARWLKTFVPEVPIQFIPAGEPFWAPR